MNRKLSTQEYMEILRKKRQEGTYDYADRVFYQGKVMLKCPAGSQRSGNTCVPSGKAPGLMDPTKSRFRNLDDLSGVNKEQAKKLAQAKSNKDVEKARKKNG